MVLLRLYSNLTPLPSSSCSRLAATRTHVTVLDIGAGAGLLSLFAALAAASCGVDASIVAVERDSRLAELAQRGFDAYVGRLPPGVSFRVVASESSDLSVATEVEAVEAMQTVEEAEAVEAVDEVEADGADELARPSKAQCRPKGGPGSVQLSSERNERQLCERAQIIVSEILGDDPLAEGVVPTMRDASRRLLDSECGVMIPARLSVFAALYALPPSTDHAALLGGSREVGGGEAGKVAGGALSGGVLSLLAPGRCGVDLRLSEQGISSADFTEGDEGLSAGGGSQQRLTKATHLATLDLRHLCSPPPSHAPLGTPLIAGSAYAQLLPHALGCTPTAVVSWFECEMMAEQEDGGTPRGASCGSLPCGTYRGRAGVTLSSSPCSLTHWRQVAHVIPLEQRRPLHPPLEDHAELSGLRASPSQLAPANLSPTLSAQLDFRLEDEATDATFIGLVEVDDHSRK